MVETAAASPRQLVLNHQDEHVGDRVIWALALTALVLVAEVASGLAAWPS